MAGELSEEEIKALRGELTMAEFDDVGDELLDRGYVEINPRRREPRQCYYVLTEKGIQKSEQLKNRLQTEAAK